MIEVTHQREIDFPAATVWAEICHFDRVLKWVPGGEQSTIRVTGAGVGAIRDIELVTQGYVQHRLIAFDENARSYAYELTAGKPIGMQAYSVEVTVTELDPRRSLLRWVGNMTADASLDEAATGKALQIALANMTTGIVACLHGAAPEYTEQPNEAWQLQHASRSGAD